MSCEDCEKIQDLTLKKDQSVAYVRVENANVAIVGCDEHLKFLLEKLRRSEK